MEKKVNWLGYLLRQIDLILIIIEGEIRGRNKTIVIDGIKEGSCMRE